jgi:hypothetical protein
MANNLDIQLRTPEYHSGAHSVKETLLNFDLTSCVSEEQNAGGVLLRKQPRLHFHSAHDVCTVHTAVRLVCTPPARP